jgi:hypothetical protein
MLLLLQAGAVDLGQESNKYLLVVNLFDCHIFLLLSVNYVVSLISIHTLLCSSTEICCKPILPGEFIDVPLATSSLCDELRQSPLPNSINSVLLEFSALATSILSELTCVDTG